MKINTYPSPYDLIYFQEIALTRNLSRAAERLGVGQPALSVALKRLESSLGAPLFLRRSQGLKLTPAGQHLLRESNRLRNNWNAVVAQTQRSATELVGRFSLGCHPSVALYAVAPIIHRIYSSAPDLEVELVHGLSRVIAERVISGEIDFGLVVNPVRHPDLVIKTLAFDEVAFWRHERGLSDVLIYNPQLSQTQTLLRQGVGRFRRSITSDSLEVIACLAGAGAGTAILPARVAGVLAPDLKRLRLPSFRDELTLLYRADLPKTAATLHLLRMLKEVRL